MNQTLPRPYNSGLETVQCDLCGSDSPQKFIEGTDIWLMVDDDVHSLVRCRRCGLLYLNPRPSPAHLSRYYTAAYEPFSSRKSASGLLRDVVETNNAANIADALEPGARILEVGCGTGTLLSLLDKRGFEVQGVENSPHAVREAHNLGLNVFQGNLFEAHLPAASFDAVVLKHVIEHLPSPSAALKEINRILKPGGQVILWLPNADSFEAHLFGKYWHGYDLPRHLFAFTKHTVTDLLERQGFEVFRVQHGHFPNDLIWSTKHFLSCNTGWSLNWLTTGNTLLLIIAAPLSMFLGLIRRSGRLTVFAKKAADV